MQIVRPDLHSPERRRPTMQLWIDYVSNCCCLNPELIILSVHSRVREEKKESFSILSTVGWGHKVNLPLLPPPSGPVKALLFYLYEEKGGSAKQLESTLLKLSHLCPAETPPHTPPPPQPVFPSALQGLGHCQAPQYIKRAQRDNWVTQIRGHRLQSLRATRGVTAATPDWIWNGFLGSRTAKLHTAALPRMMQIQKQKNRKVV